WDVGATDGEHPLSRGLHVGFRARDRAQVDAFWQAGVDAGYRAEGAPGPRPRYGPSYYGGFLLGPDGPNIQVGNHNRRRPAADKAAHHTAAEAPRRPTRAAREERHDAYTRERGRYRSRCSPREIVVSDIRARVPVRATSQSPATDKATMAARKPLRAGKG